MDFETGYEEFQGNQWNLSRFSSFAPEDLPADYIGFWAATNGLTWEETGVLLNSLGAIRQASSYGPTTSTTSVSDVISISFVSNHEFKPMIPIVETGLLSSQINWVNVDWPIGLQVSPIISSPVTWQEVGSSRP